MLLVLPMNEILLADLHPRVHWFLCCLLSSPKEFTSCFGGDGLSPRDFPVFGHILITDLNCNTGVPRARGLSRVHVTLF